jgi:hypothetical protein
MLHKCANAQCATLFRKMDEGRIFQLAQPMLARGEGPRHAGGHHAEYFWLCGPCSLRLTLVFDPRSEWPQFR